MPTTPPPADGARSAAVVNAAIRALSGGRVHWSPEALAELARLREEWQRAVEQERELGLAA
ncbi:hypothetical protein [Streptomyces sp. NPDC020983]|uniref:hypothetical protein n=1 Tax=Streptomyces sp. NPDC020983 TaxID=3365106 RepID=UPI003791E6A7